MLDLVNVARDGIEGARRQSLGISSAKVSCTKKLQKHTKRLLVTTGGTIPSETNPKEASFRLSGCGRSRAMGKRVVRQS